jgi:hypothetical protein
MNTNYNNEAPAGTYAIYNAAGEYVTWNRDFKIVKLICANTPGATYVKVPKAKVAAVPTKDFLRLTDGTLVPFTRENLRKAGF